MHKTNFNTLLIFLFLSSCFTFLFIRCTNCSSNNFVSKKTSDTLKSIKLSTDTIIQNDTIAKKYLLGQIIPSKDTNFIAIEKKYCGKNNSYIRKEPYAAFLKMYEAALKEGIHLTILSATRTYKEQKNIWEGKWTGRYLYYGKNLASLYPNEYERTLYILKYSSMPGSSRHHWGTDIDLNSTELNYFKSGKGLKVYNWLKENAGKYGFCQPYTKKDSSRVGFEEEKWHWSYTSLSSKFLACYKRQITYSDLTDFAGYETAIKVKLIEDYVSGINKDCR